MAADDPNPLFEMVRAKFAYWNEASSALGVDRKTIRRWLQNPSGIRLGDLHRVAKIFELDEASLVAAAIAAVNVQAREELRQSGNGRTQVVDLFPVDGAPIGHAKLNRN